jgi:hypothetical protein
MRTLKDIFQIGILGLKAQKWRKSAMGDTCLYRGTDGLKCFLGHSIANEDYSFSLEGADLDMPPIRRALKINSDVSTDTLLALQHIHDYSTNPENMKERYLAYASKEFPDLVGLFND